MIWVERERVNEMCRRQREKRRYEDKERERETE